MSPRALTGDRRGTALAIVLWVLVALGALSAAAVVTSITDLALARARRDHAAALGLAEAGLAEALAVLADPSSTTRPDSLSGALSNGSYQAAWAPVGGRWLIVSTGECRGIRRRVEAWAVAGESVRVVAWREKWP